MQLPHKASPRHTSNDDNARSLSVKLFGVFLLIMLVLVFGVLSGSAKVYKYKAENGQWCFTNDPSRAMGFEPIAYEAFSEALKAHAKANSLNVVDNVRTKK